MQIIMDLHTHTNHSHGKSTVAQNAAAAAAAGIKILGICEHGPRHAFYAVKDFDGMKKEARRCAMPVLTGYEFNILSSSGELDFVSSDLNFGGFHRGALPKTPSQCAFAFNALLKPRKMKSAMTDAVILAIENYDLDVLTHPGEYVPVDIGEVALAAARRGTLLEINETHPMPYHDALAAAKNGARFLLSSDAHIAEKVGKFPNSIELASKLGIESLVFNSKEYKFGAYLHLNRLENCL